MKYLFAAISFIFVLVGCKEKQTVLEGFAHPEGAVAAGDYYYVSNVGEKFTPLDKDGDGFISQIKNDGTGLVLHYLPEGDTLHSPKGMTVINNVLYVTDIDQLKGYDLVSRKKVFSLDFSSEKTLLLNDITAGPSNSLFVSAMDINKIFQVRLDSPSFKLVYEMPKPNGLFWLENKQTLFVGQFGRENNCNGAKGDIGTLTWKMDSVVYTSLGNYQGNIDGVEWDNDTLYFTNWLSHGDRKGSLHALALASGTITELKQMEVDGAGDFTLDRKNRRVVLPRMRENKVDFLSY